MPAKAPPPYHPDPRWALEVLYPSRWVNRIAAKESKAKAHYRPAYTMHKWWARRLGVAFRTILKLLQAPATRAPALRERFADFEGYVAWYLEEGGEASEGSVPSTSPRALPRVAPLVVDPFMGGGTTLMEARRLGFRVAGCDLNPVAWFVNKKVFDAFDPAAFDAAVERLERDVAPRLLSYYQTTCPACGQRADVMYWFWVKVAACPDCGTRVRLFKDYYVVEARDRKRPERVYVCPACDRLFEVNVTRARARGSTVACPGCATPVPLTKGGPVLGQKFTCPACDAATTFVNYVRAGHQFEMRLYGCEYYCPHCGAKDVKATTPEDLALFERARADLAAERADLPLPAQEIPMGYNTKQVINHGFTRWAQLFNARQLLCLGLLYRAILAEPDPATREFLVLTFSDNLEFHNLLCSYARAKRHLYNAFKSHTLHPPLMPCENNPWGTKYGRGIFRFEVRHTRKGKRYCRAPYEMIPDPKGPVKHPTPTPLLARVLNDGTLPKTPAEVLLLCGDSTRLPLPDGVADFVVTDPPYFDNVMYSELADFYYVWLRLALKDAYPWFSPPITPKDAEIIKNTTRGLTTAHYQAGLTGVFTEAHRLLKPGGLLVFTFHHKATRAWAAVLRAVVDAGFGIVACHPVRSEMSISTSIIYKKAVEMDLVLVCRRLEEGHGNPSTARAELERRVTALVATPGPEVESLSALDHFVVQLGHVVTYLSWHLGPGNFDALPGLLEYIEEASGPRPVPGD